MCGFWNVNDSGLKYQNNWITVNHSTSSCSVKIINIPWLKFISQNILLVAILHNLKHGRKVDMQTFSKK